MNVPYVNSSQVIEALKPLVNDHPSGGVAFDADGTLWSHDVGCMVFDYACEHGLFMDEARQPLTAEGAKHGIDMARATSANDAAHRLRKAFSDGNYSEKQAAEMQVWAYVGHKKSEVQAIAEDALRAGKHLSRLHDEVLDIGRWARAAGAHVLIVSASPLWVVQSAVTGLDFETNGIAGGIPNTCGQKENPTVVEGMSAPLPYGPEKVLAGRRLLGQNPWIAAFGDSSFDLDMMREAKLACGIGQKKDMLEGLKELPLGFRLRLTGP